MGFTVRISIRNMNSDAIQMTFAIILYCFANSMDWCLSRPKV